MRRKPYILLWLLLPLATLGTLRGPSAEQRQMIADIDEGSVLAWARHITGQDPNDLTSWDDFESVAVIPGTSNRANGDARWDDEVWVVVKREVNGVSVRYVEQFQPLDWGDDPNYCWFVDCAGSDANVAGTPGTPAVPATYTLSYISETSNIYGIPLGDATCKSLDAGGVVRNVGGGVVGLPFTGHPFLAGQTVRITGTTTYDGLYVLGAGTTANELQITHTYSAKSFGGTEKVVRVITESFPSIGRAVYTAAGNWYYGHNYDATSGSCITKISLAGVEDSTTLTWPVSPAIGALSSGTALVLSSGDTNLYAIAGGSTFKFDLATGACLWGTASVGGYGLAIDASGNAYARADRGGGYTQTVINQLANADGTATPLTNMGQMASTSVIGGVDLDIVVDDDLGIVIAGGSAYGINTPENTALLYNLAVRTFDDSKGDTMALGGTYVSGKLVYTYTIGSGQIVVYDGYIYVLVAYTGTTTKIHKLQWDGTNLNEITSWAGPSYGCGLFLDLYHNLVVVNQSNLSAQSTIFYYYDTAGTLLGTVGNFSNAMLGTWAALAGGTHIQGNVMPNGDLGTPEVPGSGGTGGVGTQLDGQEVCVYADGLPRGTFHMDGNDIDGFTEADYSTIIAGINYYSILETTDLHRKTQLGRKAAISTVQANVYETLGLHLGADMTYAADWRFLHREYLLKDGVARDAGDSTVGVPYTGEPFAAGDKIYIYGTINYNGLHTLAADTNNVELRLGVAYVAETFDGTEWVVSNTKPDLFTGYKGPAPFLRGTNRLPKIYLWEWDPVPLTLRGLNAKMEVTVE